MRCAAALPAAWSSMPCVLACAAASFSACPCDACTLCGIAFSAARLCNAACSAACRSACGSEIFVRVSSRALPGCGPAGRAGAGTAVPAGRSCAGCSAPKSSRSRSSIDCASSSFSFSSRTDLFIAAGACAARYASACGAGPADAGFLSSRGAKLSPLSASSCAVRIFSILISCVRDRFLRSKTLSQLKSTSSVS